MGKGGRSNIQLLFTCEHAVNFVPHQFRGLISATNLRSHRGFDPGAEELAELLASRFRAPLWRGEVSRLVVDLNRSLTNPRCINRELEMGKEDEAAILASYYYPFRMGVERSIDRASRRGPVVMISVHSFTRKLGGVTRNADVGILYDPSRQGERRLGLAWKSELKERGISTRANYPYRGVSDGHVTALRRRFGPSVYVGLELEVCNDLLRSGPGWLGDAIGDGLERCLWGSR